MTLEQAFKEFLTSEEYKGVAKQNTALGGKYRVYLTRYNRGELKSGAIVEILLANGYEVTANKVVKKKR
ncbi:MAG: hypothetical protein J0H29_18660 [Sphingobacteriales bacterium]|nr:hypothetical protein [Sphingobacteriales bacterium]OJY89585.1 MAG: hypothetical protein BGP14_21940 [Sphingobacteriales bacterium 44-15]